MAGRKKKPFVTSWNAAIPGLTKCGDGRWRVDLGGRKEVRFAEADEGAAVARAKKLLGLEHEGTTCVEMPIGDLLERSVQDIEDLTEQDYDRLAPVYDLGTDEDTEAYPLCDLPVRYRIPDGILWPWLSRLLRERLAYVAKMTAYPDLLRMKSLPPPAPAIRLDAITDYYRAENPSKSKERTIQIFEKMARHCGASNLDHLTKKAMAKWRRSIENSPTIDSAGTKKWMYGQVKSVIAFAEKNEDWDSKQIIEALNRCAVLWTPDAENAVKPKPISREHFHKLLAAAGDGPWRAWLLMGLNGALYLEELCSAIWTDVDLDKGHYYAIRNKVKRKRIPRAAVLWPETIEALRALPRKTQFVFTSPHGTRYASSRARANAFRDLCDRAGVPDDVSFAQLRDAAFTAAANGCKEDERLPKLLAGHSCGLEDNYVFRNPEIVKPATNAVYAAYGPFPQMSISIAA